MDRGVALGPARGDFGQRGWRKLRVPIHGVYDWEIKIHRSPYRMLGVQTKQGTWRYSVIENTH